MNQRSEDKMWDLTKIWKQKQLWEIKLLEERVASNQNIKNAPVGGAGEGKVALDLGLEWRQICQSFSSTVLKAISMADR